jgi:hypothetical protein
LRRRAFSLVILRFFWLLMFATLQTFHHLWPRRNGEFRRKLKQSITPCGEHQILRPDSEPWLVISILWNLTFFESVSALRIAENRLDKKPDIVLYMDNINSNTEIGGFLCTTWGDKGIRLNIVELSAWCECPYGWLLGEPEIDQKKITIKWGDVIPMGYLKWAA